MNYYFEPDLDISSLKPFEKQVIEILKNVVKSCAEIYEKQKNSDYPGGNFYPHDATAAHIEKAGSQNRDILSPYTIVRRDENNHFIAVRYSIEYAKEIAEITKNLAKASEIYSQNGYKKYSEYLTQIGKDLQSDNYAKSFEMWLTNDENINVDILLGPLETYQDKLLAYKRAFQANLRVKDNTEVDKLQAYISVISALQPASPFVDDNSEIAMQLTVRIDNVIALGGWHAELKPVGSNYPNDPELCKHGIKVLIYLNDLRARYENIPELAKTIFSSEAVSGLDDKRFLDNTSRYVTFHEIAEVISKVRYNYYKGKLKELSDIFRELNSDLTAIKSASIHVLSGAMQPEDYKDIVLASICSGVRNYYITRGRISGVKVYADGYIFAIDYLMKEGGLKLNENGQFDVDFPVLFSSISNLTTKFNTIMVEGDFDSAKKLLANYNAEAILAKFADKLKPLLG